MHGRTNKIVGKVSRRQHRWALGFGIPAALILVVVLVWDWNWFIPLLESCASAAIGRKVTMAHLHVHLGRRTKLVVDDFEIANPAGFPAPKPDAPSRARAERQDQRA